VSTATFERPGARASSRRLAALRCSPVARAFVLSRLLVLAAGVAGGAHFRQLNWQVFDPQLFSARLGGVGNLLAAGALRWDAIHYLQIAAHGYTAPGDTVFFPLYPALMWALGPLLGGPVFAGMAVSLVCFALALWLLHALTALELGPRAARATVGLLAFAPLAFFFSADYTESLFLALSVGCLYAARRERWRLAVGLGAAAALTRVPGVLLTIPLLILAAEQTPRARRRLAAIGLVPAALACFLAYLGVRGFGVLAPYMNQLGAEHAHLDTGPIGALLMAVQAAAGGLRLLISGVERIYQPSILGALSIGAESVVLLAVLIADVLALRLVWRRLPRAYAAYTVALLALCVWSPTDGQPLASLDRYTLAIFPIWMVVGAWLAERERLRILVCALGAVLLAFFTYQFATWAFVA
jgi:hypothetical protein